MSIEVTVAPSARPVVTLLFTKRRPIDFGLVATCLCRPA